MVFVMKFDWNSKYNQIIVHRFVLQKII